MTSDPLNKPLSSVARNHPSSVIYVDESGSKGSGGQFFVLGAIKTRKPGSLAREIEAVRDHHRFRDEFKFSEINQRSVGLYRDIIDVMAASDVHLKAFVIDKRTRDPFEGVPLWSAQAKVVSQLIVGSLNKYEIATVLLDSVSTPKGVAVDDMVRDMVNERFDCTSVVSALSLDSRSTPGLQLADLVASAVAFDRKTRGAMGKSQTPAAASPKAQVVRLLTTAFGLPDLGDVRKGRASILTSRPPRHAAGRSSQ